MTATSLTNPPSIFMRPPQHLAFMAAPTETARDELDRLVTRYGNCHPGEADVVICLGVMVLCWKPCALFWKPG